MSEIRVDNITDEQGSGRPSFSNGVQTSNINGGQVGGRRNLIINGAMQVAQRGTSVTGLVSYSTGDGHFTVDRHTGSLSSAGEWTHTQSTDAPSGFSYSYRQECTSSESSPNYHVFVHKIEGQSLGAAINKPKMVLSFWVKSDVTGTYSINIRDNNNSTAYYDSFDITTANEWGKIFISVPSDSSANLDADNTTSLEIAIWLSGSSTFSSTAPEGGWESFESGKRNFFGNVNLSSSVGNYWQITGIQLEVGDTATEFEHRSYGEELALCQRYYYRINNNTTSFIRSGIGYCTSNSRVRAQFFFPGYMREAPSLEQTSNPTGDYRIAFAQTTTPITQPLTLADVLKDQATVEADNISVSTNAGAFIQIFGGSFLAFDAEL